MNALVTGCAGFVGSTLAQRLLDIGVSVVGIDRFSTYYSPSVKWRNVARLESSDRFHLIEGDLVDLSPAEIGESYDVVFHQAAQAGVRSSWGSDFPIYSRDNVLATQRLLEAATRMPGLRKLVYASSSSIYGDAEAYPTSEDVRPQPVSPYGVTKLAAEHLCRLYARNYGVPAVSLRYFTVYGPRQRPDMAFHRFVRAMLREEPITVYGDGEQTRDFTYVDDIVYANLLASERGTPGMVYNIGGGHRVTVNEVLETLSDIVGWTPIIDRQIDQKGDVRHTSADTSLARLHLGYKPKTTLEQGLAAEVEWLKKGVETSQQMDQPVRWPVRASRS